MNDITGFANVLEALGSERVPEALHRSRALRNDWQRLREAALQKLNQHGDFEAWWQRIQSTDFAAGTERKLNEAAPSVRLPAEHLSHAQALFESLGAWKKGPFSIEGSGDAEAETMLVDGEWRSDLKWSRLIAAGIDFDDKKVLDVGTGNGYFLYRLAGAGARLALGLEPSLLYVAQYLALQKAFAAPRVAMLPTAGEDFTQNCACFDVVLSMGVLYHRRSPLDHLMELRGFLRPGGLLVLETLIAEGANGFSLVPEGRYAQMRNVFFLPSTSTLSTWLRRMGFVDVSVFDSVLTTSTEQRTTAWTQEPSLESYLEPGWDGAPDAPDRPTIEGHPRPRRTIFVARAP